MSDRSTIDVLQFGRPGASRVLLVVAGTHGIEAVAGQLVQKQLIDLAAVNSPDLVLSVVLVPCLNPSGLACSRTENRAGVDLNRNFIDFAAALPVNANYADVHAALIDPDPIASRTALADYQARYGFAAFVSAAHEGQYSHPDGLTFGGQALAAEAKAFLDLVEGVADSAERIAVIDIHTGLGARGAGLIISPTAATARMAFGGGVISLSDPAIGYAPPGTLVGGVTHHLRRCELLAAVLEFGTEQPEVVSRALIDSHRLRVLGPEAVEEPENVAAAMRAAFAPDDDAWREAVITRGCEVIDQALRWLSRPL